MPAFGDEWGCYNGKMSRHTNMQVSAAPNLEQDERMWMLPMAAAFLPFLVWPVEWLLPYPAVIEEVAKGILVWQILERVPDSSQRSMVLASGILFGGSEMLLYTVNAILLGSLGALVLRVLLTMPMHVLTLYLIWWLGKRGRAWLVLGIGVGMVIHGVFNAMATAF